MHHRPLTRLGLLTALALFFTATIVKSQPKDSKELIDKGIALYDKGDYEAALKAFRQVPEGDSNYAIAHYEIALTLLADSSFAVCRQYCREGLKLRDSDPRSLLLLLGHAYSMDGMSDSARFVYESIRSKNPHDHQPYYEMSVSYSRENKFSEAEAMLQKSLMRNPYHFRSHQALGSLYMQQGRFSEAFIAMMASLLCTQNAELAGTSITFMSQIANQTRELEDWQKKAREHQHPEFDKVDEILRARLALSGGYKVPSVLGDDAIIKVAYTVMDQVKLKKDDTNFVMQYYLPVYKQVLQQNLFDPFVLLLFSNYGIEVVEKFAKKEKKTIEEAKKLVFPYFNDIRATRVLDPVARKSAPRRFYVYNDVFTVASHKQLADDIQLLEGPVQFYSDGNLTAEGTVNSKGEREGEWKFYYNNGTLRLVENYKNGELHGEVKKYRRSGIIKEAAIWENGKEKQAEFYTYSGKLNNVVKYQTGNEAEYTSLHFNGHKEAVYRLTDKKILDGKYTTWYSDGTVHREQEYLGGELHGTNRQYHRNGKLASESTYQKGQKVGKAIDYYKNGNKESEFHYSKGEPEGAFKTWNEDGALASTGSFRNGKKHGLESLFDGDRAYGSIEWKNGVPQQYNFVSPEGKVFKSPTKGELSVLRRYFPDGSLESEVRYKDGKVNGKARYYYSTGSLRREIVWKDDKKHGPSVSYYKNGNVEDSSVYQNGEQHGPYISRHANGALRAEGYLLNDKKTGIWKYYGEAGALETERFFLEDYVNGPAKHYHANGKPDYFDYYDRGLIMRMEQFDTAGNRMHEETYPLSTGHYKLIYPNGKTRFKGTLIKGDYEGQYTAYYPDGTMRDAGYYVAGQRDSISTSWHPNGGVRLKANYRLGDKQGLWTWYSVSGTVSAETAYLDDQENGKSNYYTGERQRWSYNMFRDRKDGEQIVWGENQQIALILLYKEGNLVGYTWLDKEGNRKPLVAVAKGTATIKAWYPNGQVSAELNYVENTQSGPQKIYFSNGNIAEEYKVIRSDYEGPYRIYHPNGQLAYETVYSGGVTEGREKIFDENGRMHLDAGFSKGVLHGPAVYNDQKTKTTVNYHYGLALSVTRENQE